MKVLGIESSCDETGVALVEAPDDPAAPPRLLAEALHTQAAMHADYGGVVPELASRDHIRRVLPLLERVLAQAGAAPEDIGLVAYTRGPGLAGALLVGAGVAVSLAAALGRPALGVHHLEGHLLSPFLADPAPAFPFVALLVSGGHTQLMHVAGVGRYELLGLGYPGGPALSRLAEQGDAAAFALPRPLLHSGDLDFSFAGLKTAVLTQHRKLGPAPGAQALADLAAATQEAIVDVLVAKSLKALDATGAKTLVVAGGVGANRRLRERLDAAVARRRAVVHYPPLALCTDNGAMIALAAALRLQHGLAVPQSDGAFDVRPRWPLADISA